jgi:hypothetical protein
LIYFLLIKEEQSLAMLDPTLTNQAWLYQDQILEQLGLYLHILSLVDANNNLLEVKLFEFYSQNRTIIHIPLVQSSRFVFHISLNLLQLSLRGTNSLLELRFSTREHEPIQGNYYKWNDTKNEHRKFNVTVAIDQSLINQFNTI